MTEAADKKIEPSDKAKPWFKKWWGILLAVVFFPYFALYYIWYIWKHHSDWPKSKKWLATLGLAFAAIVIFSVAGQETSNSISPATNQSQTNSGPTDAEAQANRNKLKETAVSVPYRTLYRDINTYKGKSVHYKGKVIQINGGDSVLKQMRVDISQNEYGSWEDTILVDWVTTGNEKKILEDDIIDFYGTVKGETSYESVLGATIYLPQVSAFEVNLVE